MNTFTTYIRFKETGKEIKVLVNYVNEASLLEEDGCYVVAKMKVPSIYHASESLKYGKFFCLVPKEDVEIITKKN